MTSSHADAVVRILTINELADRWRTTRMTIHRLLKKGALAGAFKVGGQWRFPTGMIEAIERGELIGKAE